jgi:hypothetical protein
MPDTTVTEIKTVDLDNVRGGIGFWGKFGLNIASQAIAGFGQGGLRGAAQAALGATSQGLGAAAQGAAG